MSVDSASQSVSEGVDTKGEPTNVKFEDNGVEGANGGAKGLGEFVQRCDTTDHTEIRR